MSSHHTNKEPFWEALYEEKITLVSRLVSGKQLE